MILSFIVAASTNNAIGRDNELPWRLPEDMKFFKRTTMGRPVLMGRKTYESLRKSLPGRLNIVVSGRTDLKLPSDVLLCHDLNTAIDRLQQEDADEGFIIGGGEIFKQAMPMADRIHMTRVHTVIEGADAFFPVIDHTHWKLVWEEHHHADEKHRYDFTFQQFDRLEM